MSKYYNEAVCYSRAVVIEKNARLPLGVGPSCLELGLCPFVNLKALISCSYLANCLLYQIYSVIVENCNPEQGSCGTTINRFREQKGEMFFIKKKVKLRETFKTKSLLK